MAPAMNYCAAAKDVVAASLQGFMKTFTLAPP
jgi:hypothetical protein